MTGTPRQAIPHALLSAAALGAMAWLAGSVPGAPVAAAFCNPGSKPDGSCGSTVWAFGNAPPNMPHARMFGFKNENPSIIKRTPIKESLNVEFRAEFFNLFNRTIFGGSPQFGNGIDNNLNDTIGFGKIGGQQNQPRIIQFGLKLNW